MNVRELIQSLEEIAAVHSDDMPVIDSNCEPIGISVNPNPKDTVLSVIIF